MYEFRNLLIVAAPCCCGKTTFVHRLMTGEDPDLAERLLRGQWATEPWIYKDMFMHEAEIVALARRGAGNVMLHYTLPYPAPRFLLRPGYDKQSRLAMLRRSRQTSAVTLLACRSTLLRRVSQRRGRIFQRLERGQISRWKAYRLLATLNHLERVYASKDRLRGIYARWFGFLRDSGVRDHHLVDVTGTPRLITESEWDAVVSAWDPPSSVDVAPAEPAARAPGFVVAHRA